MYTFVGVRCLLQEIYVSFKSKGEQMLHNFVQPY